MRRKQPAPLRTRRPMTATMRTCLRVPELWRNNHDTNSAAVCWSMSCPWIRIANHKKGMAPVKCVVRNNLATAFSNAASVREENNLRIQDPAAFFVDPDRFDLHLRPGAAAIDTGSSLSALKLDRDHVPGPGQGHRRRRL